MTNVPCTVDSPTIEWFLDSQGLSASLILDPDPTNALYLSADGLAARYGPMPSCRRYRSTTQALLTNDIVNFDQTRWDTGGMAVSSAIALPATGLWLIGYSLAIALGAVAANQAQGYLACSPPAGIVKNYGFQSTAGVGVPQAGTAESFTLSNVVYSYELQFSQISLSLTHSFGGTIASVPSSIPGPGVAGAAEMAGTELFCHLVIPA